jgi:predicted nucleic acid-binding protein
MTAVIADTSPLNYLVLIEAVEILQQLYERISVPEAVIAELRSPDAPLPVRQWAAVLPAWVEVHAVAIESLADPRWQPLHAGERAALALAILLQADLVLMDERTGVGVARKNGFRVTGTLGILDEAARQELLDLATVIEKLKATTFRYPRSLVAELLAESRERRKE